MSEGTIWKQLLPDEKVRAVKKMARQDMTARQIADALGTKPHHVRTVADKHNIVLMHHVSPDTLPVVHDETEDMRDTPFSRRYAAWLKSVEGARNTLKSTGIEPVENVSGDDFRGAKAENASSGSGRFVLANKPATTIEARDALGGATADANTSVRSAA